MFDTLDHILGAITIRILRKYLKIKRKPDLVYFDEFLAVGGVSKLELIKKEGINAILDMRMEDYHNEINLKKLNIAYMRLKVPDRGFPSINDSSNAIEWINNHKKNGHKVLIHCNLGRGRAPLMSIAYLISEGIKRNKAIQRIKDIRKSIFLNKDQLKFLEIFEKKYS